MNNLAIQNFYKNIINLINNCNLPVGTAYFIVKDVLHDLEQAYLIVLKEESNEPDKQIIQDINLFPEERQKKGDNE